MGLCHDTAMARGGRVKLGLSFSGRLGEQIKTRVFVFIKRACLDFSRAYVIALQISIIAKKKKPPPLSTLKKTHPLSLKFPRREFFSLRAEA